MFKKGDKVSQVLPAPVVGEVAGFDVDQETGTLQVRIEWTDANGDVNVRHFNPDQLQAYAPTVSA